MKENKDQDTPKNSNQFSYSIGFRKGKEKTINSACEVFAEMLVEVCPESLGGVNADEHKGNLPIEWESAYYIYGDCTIQFARIEYLEKLNYKIYTLEEYEQREL